MTGLNGFMLPDGAVCLTGTVIEERMERAEAREAGSWPWNGAIMQGDCRVSVAWPDRTVTGGTTCAKGCLAVGVIDPNGMLRIVTMQDFDKVGT